MLEYEVEELKPPLPPWRGTKFKFDEVKLERSKEQYTVEELRKKADEKVADITSEVVIFTDGSTDAEQNNGGAGVFVQDKRTGVTERLSYPAGKICSSYGAEGVALLRALELLERRHISTATICTDSLSLQKALANDNWKDAQNWLRKIKEKSYTLKTEVTILWLPSHCGCEGNEEADRLADEGTKLDQTKIPITFAIAKARVRKRKWEVTHERAKQVYGDRKKPKLELELPGKEVATVSENTVRKTANRPQQRISQLSVLD